MKKIVLNVSDTTYEKLRFEAIHEQKSIHKILEERIFFKPFHKEVEEGFDSWMEKEFEKIIGE